MNILLKKQNQHKERARFIRANDPEFNSSFDYANNTISTAKYNVFTFLPKNLFEQFQRIANAYFLVLLILQLIPVISSLTWVTTIIPLVAVLSITALKDLVDDIQRHQSDSLVNNRLSWVIRRGKLVELCWCKVVVGDIIRMENNQFVAADLLLLSTNEQTNLCFIETTELDGETNLKVRNSLPSASPLRDNIHELSEFDGEIECEPPNNNLNRFTGILRWKNMSFPLSNAHMLLRGCVLRNTRWCYGLVVYAGKDTKLMQNSGHTSLKRTSIDRLLNLLIIGIFGFMFVICTLCAIGCGFWESMTGKKFQVYLPWEDFVPGQKYHGESHDEDILGPVVIAALVFLSYVIIINTAVPISLYVSVELIRFSHSWWINWDKKMYHQLTDMPSKARTTLLNEELGQIHYIFTDKTGTLTKNVMVFKKCSINGHSYGHQEQASTDKLKHPDSTSEKDPEEDDGQEDACQLEDPELMKQIEDKDRFVCQFFRLLALCHTVMPEERDGKLVYQAQSPDEGSLVMAARKFGFVFLNRQTARFTSETQEECNFNLIDIEVLGQLETYELLAILDFDSFRKRMSVIVRRNGVINLYCKGADSVIYERLGQHDSQMKDVTSDHLNHFARSGLRTLCCAVKTLSPTYYKDWSSRYEAAGLLMDNREEMFNELYEEIEQDLILIGCTAIEDKLQDGVPYTISRLICAGIKIWVLTGDKEETAVNVGFSCKLLSESTELVIINAENERAVHRQIDLAKAKIKSATKPTDGRNVDDVSWNSLHFGDQPHLAIKQATGFALIINGHSLVYALSSSLKLTFLEVSCLCKTVICCRLTPIQKAQVVHLIKHYKKSTTLAVGDGANDVSMIKTHIGVGISGHEGRQAVLASDYSIAQFRFLERLILVHGRWSYIRISKFLYYFFYKNFAFTLCHVWYAIFCGYSAQTLYDPFFIALYNLLFTPLPVMALAIFEQDVDDENSCLYPKLYLPGIKSSLFNTKIFLCSFMEGILTSVVLYFFPYGAFQHAVKPNGTDISDLQSVGFVIGTNLIVIVTLRCALETTYWTFFNHFAIWGSLFFYFCVMFVLYSDLFGYEYQGTATHTLDSANFWLTLILTLITLTVPVIVIKLYFCDMHPTLSDTIRLKHKKASVFKKPQKMLRRALNPLTWRHSGYAFSHQVGFGKLITTGSMMTFRMSKIGQNVALCGCRSVPAQFKLQQPVAKVLEDPEDARVPHEGQAAISRLPSSGSMEIASDFAIGRNRSISEVPPVIVATEDWIV